MKPLIRSLITILFFTGCYTFLNAQLGLGLRGGINFATAELEEKIDGTWESDYKDFVPRINAGLIAEISFSEMFALQPEVNFIQKGYKTTFQNGTTYDSKVLMNYVEVPVFVKGRFGTDLVKFNVLAGPSIGYAFNGKVKSDDTEIDIDFDKDQIKQYDVSALLGIGVELKAGPGNIFLDARLNWGITNLDDSSNSDDFNWHNRGIGIGVGYIYRLIE